MNTVYENTVRNNMWERLIPGYKNLTKNDKKHRKVDFAESLGKKPHEVHNRKEIEDMNTMNTPSVLGPVGYTIMDFNMDEIISYAPLNTPVPKTQPKKGKKTMSYYDEDLDMYVDSATTDESKKRSYLASRLSQVSSRKTGDLADLFNLNAPRRPTTLEGIIDAIKNGEITYDAAEAKKEVYNPMNLITWRSPAIKEDRAGYEAAVERKNAAYTKTMDVIKIADVAEGLKALQAFEANSFAK